MKQKLMQTMLEHQKKKKLNGRIEMDDAYMGGKRSGKRGRGASHKTPFVAVIQTDEKARPQQIHLRTVKGFQSHEIARYAQTSLGSGSCVFSDALACFKSVKLAGCTHTPIVCRNQKSVQDSTFWWINTIIGNIKNVITGTYHYISSKHTPRYLATFEYRFNRRYDKDQWSTGSLMLP